MAMRELDTWMVRAGVVPVVATFLIWQPIAFRCAEVNKYRSCSMRKQLHQPPNVRHLPN